VDPSDVDLSREASMRGQDPERFERPRRFVDWVLAGSN
jgi:hypothetical protein